MFQRILFSLALVVLGQLSGLAQVECGADTVPQVANKPAIDVPKPTAKEAELQARIDSLNSQVTDLKQLLRESHKETEQGQIQIGNLKQDLASMENNIVKPLKASNDSLQRQLILIASNFMYIPYEEYSIQEIAIPSFIAAKGSPLFSKHHIRLEILENYAVDIESLISFLSAAEKDSEFGNPFGGHDKGAGLKHKAALEQMPLFTRYSRYDDWQQTFLGTQIVSIQKELGNSSGKTPEKIRAIRLNLEKLIH